MAATMRESTFRTHINRKSSRALRVRVRARSSTSRTDSLRQLLLTPGIHQGPCCHDGISARLIERAGFPYAFMSGFCTSAARLGAPDTGLISYYEMVDQGRYVNEATKSIPIIGDGDTGYGNALNVKRTVRGYAQAGFAGILIEDQLMPKSCGHVRGKRVTSRDEAVARIRAAVDAREEGADILILARTDARQAESLEEALWRAAAFADAGADILFIDALESEQEMRAFCRLAPGVPKMANMLEGGGKTPLLPPEKLEEIGFKLVAYPLSLLGVSIRAMETALEGLKEGRIPPVTAMGSFLDIQRAVGFPEYYVEEERYAVNPAAGATSSGAASSSTSTQQGTEQATGEAAGPPPVEPVVIPPGGSSSSREGSAGAGPGSSNVLSVDVLDSKDQGDGSAYDAFRRSRYLKVQITDQRTNMVKLETRIPAGFLQGLSALVPQASGLNLEALMQQALGEKKDLNDPLVDFNSGNDNIRIWLE